MSVYSYYPFRTDATWSPISSKTASDYLQESASSSNLWQRSSGATFRYAKRGDK